MDGRFTIRRLCNDERGATAVEFAILAVPFFLIVTAIMETALVLLGELSIESAVERTARDIMVAEDRVWDQAAVRETLCGHVSVLLKCDELQLDVRSLAGYADLPAPIEITNRAVDTSAFDVAVRADEPLIVVRAVYAWPITVDLVRQFLSDLDDSAHLLVATSVVQMEAF